MDQFPVIGEKAIFLDRDGTIIRDAHYLSDPADVVLLPKAAQAIALLREAGFKLFLFTNQSGVGRGRFTLEAVHRCNDRMIELLGQNPAMFVEICIAPEHPDKPAIYRKPNPRFIKECLIKYRLKPSTAWMVGDKLIDVEAGINAEIQAALIDGEHSIVPPSGIRRYATLYDFALAVINGFS